MIGQGQRSAADFYLKHFVEYDITILGELHDYCRVRRNRQERKTFVYFVVNIYKLTPTYN